MRLKNIIIKSLFILILLFVFNGEVLAQNMFKDKFEDCNTKHFTTEKDTIAVTANEKDILYVLANHFTEKNVKSIKGLLSLQIIVDTNGNSCLLSVDNETNIKTQTLNIKNIIDNKLTWKKPEEMTSVILGIMFYGNKVEMKRIGMSQEKGFHVIR